MRRQPLTDTITQLTRMRIMNAYLVREDDGLTLVDTMMAGSAAGLLAAAAASMNAPIRRIALTHGHGDHAGSLDALRAKLGSDVEVLAPERDARIMAGDRSLEAGEGSRRLKGSWPKVAAKPDRLLSDGDRVGSLRVVASPGHTPGHVAFLDLRDNALICGDALHTLGGTTVAGVRNLRFPFVTMATWDPDRAADSARELRALQPTLLAPGHGRALREPLAAIDRALERTTTDTRSPARLGGAKSS
ncbi:MAG: MBL fold metallo-hydrolase [Solirubrobacteraceae bacterium]|nr:MBL fold metallo-hydrolase [Solirubrobacteraceae bacterium]